MLPSVDGRGRTVHPPESPSSAVLGEALPELDEAVPDVPPLLPPSALLPLVPLVPLVPPLGEASLPPLEPASAAPPPSDGEPVTLVTVIVRVVVVTASPLVPAPLAAMPATYNVTVPGALGAMNENL